MKFTQVSVTLSADVATNGTITMAYPAGLDSTKVVTGSGAKMFAKGLQSMFTQGASNFSMAYGGSMVLTYLGATTIPLGTRVDFFVPVPEFLISPRDAKYRPDAEAAVTAITDSTGGVANTTFAAITAPGANATTSLSADMAAVKNALAQVAATLNLLITAVKNAGITT